MYFAFLSTTNRKELHMPTMQSKCVCVRALYACVCREERELNDIIKRSKMLNPKSTLHLIVRQSVPFKIDYIILNKETCVGQRM